MTATLDQQLQDLCDIHELTSISIHAYSGGEAGKFMGVNVHGKNALGSASGHDKSASELFAAAVLDLRAKQLIAVPELAPMEKAAPGFPPIPSSKAPPHGVYG
ncbi:hypothetical protein [Sphingobium baderi]|uniref:Uncharacterized protein n=1 Tax=Sphingobium baderi LL03 TaxID=1114964 RepID=T0I3J2_9SPHN|nr:hypothetical protein [Sphingobium baderi]EQB06205.1 hypothetical protein L485_00830 [Sphingobium baderi LL03]KMS62781.1 hypothetical protein V475_06310 [Sphingobium baderi LL03]